MTSTADSLLPQPFAGRDALNLDDPVQYWTSSAYSFNGQTGTWYADFSLNQDPGGVEVFLSNTTPIPSAMVRLVRTLR